MIASSSLYICVFAFVAMFGGALIGIFAARALPRHHLSAESATVVKLSAGIVVALTSLVLALMLSAANSTFSVNAGIVKKLSSDLIHLDHIGKSFGSKTVLKDASFQLNPNEKVGLVGRNGTGKTTTVAKLARRLQGQGRSVLLAAADTFRAGAVAQLKIWADRLNAPFVGGAGDPAAVAFDAVQAAVARGIDTVLVDTAGRLHTDERLIEELKKVVRVVAKQRSGAPHEALLVIDATVGQNAVEQARVFAAAVPLTGLVITKLDGTAKGGSVVALRRAVSLPIRFLGTGEGLDDLEPFDPGAYARRLVGD